MPRWRKECFETAEACVSPSAKRPAKSETPLYIQIYSTPRTSHHTLSAPLTKLYIYRAVDGRWALFSWCVYLTYGKGRETGGSWGGGGHPEAQCGPLVIARGNADSLQFFFFFHLSLLLPTCVLSFCSHTVWVFTVKSAADLRKILHNKFYLERQMVYHVRKPNLSAGKTFATCLWF